MSNQPSEDAAALVAAKLAEGRATGRYSDELDERLATQFQRAGVDPLGFPAFAALTERVGQLRRTGFGRPEVPRSSSIPGGSAAHGVVARIVGRQIDGVLRRLSSYANSVSQTFEAVTESIDELRSLLTTEVFGDIDAVHQRLVGVEHRLARLEARSVPDDEPAEHA